MSTQNVLNIITYTARAADGTRHEAQFRLHRAKKLTVLGAQRVLRRNFRKAHEAHGNLVVNLVETFIDER